MIFIVALLNLFICVFFVIKMIVRTSIVNLFLGVLSVMAIAYYIFPIFFIEWTALGVFDEEKILSSQLMHFLYFSLFCLSFFVVFNFNLKIIDFKTSFLDVFFVENRKTIFICCFAFYFAFISTQSISAYSAESLESFFLERSSIYSFISGFAVYALSIMAVIIGYEFSIGKRRSLMAYSFLFFVIIVYLASSGQRLTLITPFVFLIVSLTAWGLGKKAMFTSLIAILALLIYSPFAVTLRGAAEGEASLSRTLEKVIDYNVEGGVLESGFKSFGERSDLIENTIRLKEYIDVNGYVGSSFYYSVFMLPIPRFFLGESKPYQLSGDGTIWDEISVLAWRLKNGASLGSLTAFGGITAYRQGGWVSVIIDSLLNGIITGFLIRTFCDDGVISKVFLSLFFVSLTVKKVPPSLFENLAFLFPLLPQILIVYLINKSKLFHR